MKTVYVAVHKTCPHSQSTQGYKPSQKELDDTRFNWYSVKARTNQLGYQAVMSGGGEKIT